VVSASTFVDTNSVLKRCWHKLDPYIQAKIRQRKPYNDGWGIRFAGRFYPGEPDDRSAAVFQIGQSLKQAGATPREVLAVIKQTCFWLSREEEGKREDPNRLLNKIFAVESAKPGINAADPADWEGIAVPRQEWIVQRLVPARKVTALYGDGGTGKTLLALQMAVSAALGKEFLGISVEPGRVFALLAENEDDDSHVALDAICWHFGATLGDLRGMMRVASRAGLDSILMAFPLGRGHPSELFQQLLTDIKIFGPKLVILDTAADLFGGNENDRGQVRRFLSEICTRVAVETGAAVLLCAHPSVAGLRSSEGSGGSTAWNNSVRSRLFLRRDIRDGDQEDDPDVRILELKKANLVQRGLAICLRWKDGVFVEDNTHLRIGSEAEIKRMRDIVDVVASRYESGRPFSAHVQSQTGWLGMWLIENMKVSRSNAKRIILGLLDKGLIVELDEPHRHRKGKDRRFL
jgi:RecA-family ATPase